MTWPEKLDQWRDTPFRRWGMTRHQAGATCHLREDSDGARDGRTVTVEAKDEEAATRKALAQWEAR